MKYELTSDVDHISGHGPCGRWTGATEILVDVEKKMLCRNTQDINQLRPTCSTSTNLSVGRKILMIVRGEGVASKHERQ